MNTLVASRRSFLKVGAAAAGGLVIGLALPVRTRAAATAAPADTAINAYVRVATDGRVTLLVPKSEMGQGIYTGLFDEVVFLDKAMTPEEVKRMYFTGRHTPDEHTRWYVNFDKGNADGVSAVKEPPAKK